MYGRELRLPIDVMFGAPEGTPSVRQYARDLTANLEKAYNNVRKHLQADQRRQKDIYDRYVSGPSYSGVLRTGTGTDQGSARGARIYVIKLILSYDLALALRAAMPKAPAS
jgi:hypothetical protein